MIAFPNWSDRPVEEQNIIVGTIVDIVLEKLQRDAWLLEDIFPERMIAEDSLRCLSVIRELSLWARDGWTHYLGYLHEYALNGVLHLWNSMETEEQEQTLNVKRWESDFHATTKGLDWSSLHEGCFKDVDFLDTEDRFRDWYEYDEKFLFRYDFTEDDLFFLPRDIREEYRRARDRHTFWTLVSTLPEIVQDLLIGVGVERLLYNSDGSARSEKDAQVLIEGLLDPFCKLYDISMTREHPVGSGLVDFKLSRGSKQALIELKMYRGNMREIKEVLRALRHQVPAYQRPFELEVAFLVVLCLDSAPEELRVLAQNNEVHDVGYLLHRTPLLHLIELKSDRIVPSRRS